MTDAMFDLPSEPGVKELPLPASLLKTVGKTNVSKLKAA